MWERTVQECYCTRLCHRAKSSSVRKTTKKFKSWWKLLLMAANVEWTIHWNEGQWSVNDLWLCKYGNYTVIWLLLSMTNVLAAFIDKRDSNTITAPFREWVSTERQRFVVLWPLSSHRDLVAVMHNRCIASFCSQKRQQHCHRPILRMSVNAASTICGFVSMGVTERFGRCYA